MITGFQLRAAIASTKLFTKEISEIINLHQVTLLRLKRTPNLEYLNCHSKNFLKLEDFFRKQSIIFPEIHKIKLISDNFKLIRTGHPVITRFQLVVARTATGLTQLELSNQIGISSATLSSLENLENEEFIYSKKVKVSLLKSFFEHLGIVFEDNFTIALIKDPKKFIS